MVPDLTATPLRPLPGKRVKHSTGRLHCDQVAIPINKSFPTRGISDSDSEMKEPTVALDSVLVSRRQLPEPTLSRWRRGKPCPPLSPCSQPGDLVGHGLGQRHELGEDYGTTAR
jgi:hypothetical protein